MALACRGHHGEQLGPLRGSWSTWTGKLPPQLSKGRILPNFRGKVSSCCPKALLTSTQVLVCMFQTLPGNRLASAESESAYTAQGTSIMWASGELTSPRCN